MLSEVTAFDSPRVKEQFIYIYMSLYKIELLKCKVDSDWIHRCVYSKNRVVLVATESRREI